MAHGALHERGYVESRGVCGAYDGDAHYVRKETTTWVGYKVHLTETCGDDAPCLITHVATSTGPIVDAAATPVIHDALERRALLPRTRYVGQDRTHLGHVLTAVGLNFLRLAEWLSGIDRPHTRRSRFARLMAA